MNKISSLNHIDFVTETKSITKPCASITQLIDILKPHADRLFSQAEQHLSTMDFSKRQCFLLHKGHVSVCRQSDGLVINSENAPFVFGFSDLLQTRHQLSIYPAPTATLSSLCLEDAWDIIKREDEWRSLSELLIYISNRIYTHCTRTSGVTAYDTIRTLLLELYAEPEIVRSTTSVFQYIKSRCHLSRSCILQILAQLRIGNYINCENGKLNEVSYLPSKF